jgi:hypothetical protein
LSKANPHFYHLAEPANLASIRHHGLLSAERLMKLARIKGQELRSALGQHRAGSVVLPNGVIIRDQSPMPPQALARALPPGVTPADWYRFLNGFVFLWANRERLDRHLVAFRKRPQVLLVFDAARLIEERGDVLLVSPINSGNALRRAAPRSFDLFVPYRVWQEEGWPAMRGKTRSPLAPPAEVAFHGDLPLEPFLVKIRGT